MADGAIPQVKDSDKMPAWLSDLAPNARLWLQAGFAGIVSVTFIFLVWFVTNQQQASQRQLIDQLQSLQKQQSDRQKQQDDQAAYDRSMYREQMARSWDETRTNREELRAAVAIMARAVDRLDSNQRQIKQETREIQKDVHTLKTSGPEAFKAPDPREKPE